MTLTYGYLRGTFGLPYGGYCIRPQSLPEIVLHASNENQRMFCVVGRYSEVTRWLEGSHVLVLNQSAMEATFTHELVVEVYTEYSALSRMIWGLDRLDVQLVIRIARTWDRQREVGSQFHPLLKLIVPSGISLDEIRRQLQTAVAGETVDATHNKELLNNVLSRVSTYDTVGSGCTGHSQMSPNSLPPYEYRRRLPPSYYD
ncbi:hypothetical protein IWW55_002141 [Coemansia sp. RSA 2706]|nr:hypothetical protein IWW55_002141 [Coemansia sp. RSA 2706]KAJ2306826.1 hypothetical protein IWW54_004611 [Coemansia sp. RSA 2705]KAJ2317181.1 hypothetical protein IWW52_003264 [Coemansia sp. RSA 2704]KAJ2724679.1 hypothetical protein H4R23_004235 [Coemansia sp. Cherry 401B]